MLHQIQLYNLTDYSEPEKRQVIATQDGLQNANEIEAWKQSVLSSDEMPEVQEGFSTFLVAENSPWFIRQDDTHALVGIANVADTANNGATGEVELLPYEVAGRIQLELDEKRRLEAIERERQLKEHIASFKPQSV